METSLVESRGQTVREQLVEMIDPRRTCISEDLAWSHHTHRVLNKAETESSKTLETFYSPKDEEDQEESDCHHDNSEGTNNNNNNNRRKQKNSESSSKFAELRTKHPTDRNCGIGGAVLEVLQSPDPTR
ncbi:hypothetical protein D9C73_027895 [Collichthys lucidus]|uniref:Uncharacterized protein n=1 Tax=Collichthys lucidus TaxID=240159 RepID=A0A4U5TVL5_COLLU|nr:hypothetical protein D9C73_027895 [Collichthys lucidus]